MKSYSLAYLTSAPLPAPDAITLAARHGYSAVGLRLLPAMPGGATNDLIGKGALVRETMGRVRDTGVTVFDVEIVRIDPAFSLEPIKPLLETAAALEARAVLVVGDDPQFERMTANYATFCDAAAPFGLTADIEFMPWTVVRDARTALRLVNAANRPNAGILVDTLHVGRSGTTLDDIAAIPASMLHYAQLCDAPAEIPTTLEGLLHTARHARLLPGDGGLPLRPMFDSLQRDVPVSLELPNDAAKSADGVDAWAVRAIAAARRVLGDTYAA